MGKGKKSKGTHKQSSGKRSARRRARKVKELKRKVSRWEKYQASGKKCGGQVPTDRKVSEKRSPSTRSRHNNWDTTKLKKHIEALEKM